MQLFLNAEAEHPAATHHDGSLLMIVAQLIKKVTVGRGYQISVEFNITFDELQRAITGEYTDESRISTAFLPELKLENSA